MVFGKKKKVLPAEDVSMYVSSIGGWWENRTHGGLRHRGKGFIGSRAIQSGGKDAAPRIRANTRFAPQFLKPEPKT